MVILLTDAAAPRPLPLPVALRLELCRQGHEQLAVTVAKEKHGRVFPSKLVKCQSLPAAEVKNPQWQSWG
jgi:recombination protein RecA